MRRSRSKFAADRSRLDVPPRRVGPLRALRAAATLALALGASLDDARPEESCFEPWWRGHLDAAFEERRGPEAMFPVRLVEHVRDTASAPQAIDARMEKLARDDKTSPLVAAEIEALLLESDVARGDTAAAGARRARLGLVEAYEVVRSSGSERSVADEIESIELSTWRRFDVSIDGVLPLAPLFHPDEQTSALARFWVRSSSELVIALRFGADDRAELDVNGVGLETPDVEHDLRFDQHAVALRLARGWNRITFRVHQKAGAWLLISRLTALDGAPLPPGVSVAWPSGPSDESSLARRADPVANERPTTLVSLLDRSSRRGDRGSEGRATRLALELGRKQSTGRGDSQAVELVREAHESDAESVDAAWVLSMLEEDASRRREALEAVLRLHPRDPAALRRLARHYFEHGQDAAAIATLERSIAACDVDSAHLIGWKTLLDSSAAFPGRAVSLIEPLLGTSAPPALEERFAVLLRASGFARRARRAYEDYLARHPGDVTAREDLAELTLQAGDEARYVQLLESGLEIHPYRSGWLVRLIRLDLVNGRLDAARRNLERLARLDPDDPGYLSLVADVALTRGAVPDAVAAMRRAIEEGGPPGPIEERIDAHAEGESRQAAGWAISPAEAEALFSARAATIPSDAPAVVVARNHYIRLKPNGLADRSVQVVRKILNAEPAAAFRFDQISYSPGLQRFDLLEARLTRSDGAKFDASRSERPLLPDADLRIWYDSRVVTLAYPRLEPGDLLTTSYRISDRGSNNPIGEGYFGESLILGDLIPVLATRVVVDAPAGLSVRHALANLGSLESATSVKRSALDDGGSRLVIELPEMPAAAVAPDAPPATERLPYAVLGTTADWNDLGATYARLMEDQLRVTPDIRAVVGRLVAESDGRRNLIESIYGWVIENTRYVALEFGIHAIKPYDVGAVFRRRHGDCKDKASLLVSMLEEAGVRANVALLRTRSRGAFDSRVPTFSAFDHAIVHIPEEDLWLDGTVLHYGTRELPAEDQGALALVVSRAPTDDSLLVTTPDFGAAGTRRLIEEVIDYTGEGEIVFDVRVAARGEAAAAERAYFRLNDRRHAVARERLRRVHPDILSFRASFDSIGLESGEVSYGYSGVLGSFGRSEGDASSVPVGLTPLELPFEIPPRGRDVPLKLAPPYEETVRTRFRLGQGVREESLPRSLRLESVWGVAELSVDRSARSLTVERSVIFRGGTVEPEDMERFARWAEEWRQLFEQRIRLLWE